MSLRPEKMSDAIGGQTGARSVDNKAFIDFLYRIFFGRNAERAAVEHWDSYLTKGSSPLEIFNALWNSAEFATKAQQNRYFKAPRTPLDAARAGTELITDEYLEDLIALLRQDRLRLLEIGAVRGALAQWRYRDLTQDAAVKVAPNPEMAIPDAAAYNEFTLRSFVDDDRPAHMVRPLLSIGRVFENVSDLKLLSIGPRTETELFALLAGGFALQNISMVDIVSYSPFVQIGDMHAMSFADNQFDVILCGDVLAYSKTPSVAVKEMLRVAKDKAIVSLAHGVTAGYSPLWERSKDAVVEGKIGLSVQTTEDILRLFRPNVGQIYFRCEPENPKAPKMNRVLTIFEITKT